MKKVYIYNSSKHPNPEYATINSAGMDLRADIDSNVILKSLERAIIPTGIYVELPEGHELQIRPRSGLAAKQGVTVLNTPGTIDSDYRGEIKVILINLSTENQTISNGDRIAQAVLATHEQIEWSNVTTAEQLSETKRGDGGFGHTGNK
jgi:dUTP pyrophosphatase